MGELGLLGMTVPPEYGGAGVDAVSASLAMEEVASACPSTSIVFAVQNSLVCEPIAQFGSEDQKREFLPPLTSSEKLGCFCLTEPSVGSDAGALKSTAAQKPDHWCVNGVKRFISNSKEASLCLFFAVTDPDLRHKGISAFLIDSPSRGLEVGQPERKSGLEGSSLCDLRLDGVQVPLDRLMGDEGQGFEIAMQSLDGGRIGVAAQGVGFARACLEASVEYARERETFGVPISHHQSIQWKVADMATEVEGARLLYLKAARLKQKGLPYSAEAAMAKVYASDVAQRASSEAVQIHGGNGYIRDYPVEKFYRAAKAAQIYEGTNEVLRQLIANHLMN
jgi:alkylation response protein AidB-like acyl-CoA dehydrogenase